MAALLINRSRVVRWLWDLKWRRTPGTRVVGALAALSPGQWRLVSAYGAQDIAAADASVAAAQAVELLRSIDVPTTSERTQDPSEPGRCRWVFVRTSPAS